MQADLFDFDARSPLNRGASSAIIALPDEKAFAVFFKRAVLQPELKLQTEEQMIARRKFIETTAATVARWNGDRNRVHCCEGVSGELTQRRKAAKTQRTKKTLRSSRLCVFALSLSQDARVAGVL